MKRFKWVALAAASAWFLASCGGSDGEGTAAGNRVGFTQLVSFGDSLSDVGSYKVGTVAALGGGQWTVNSATAQNWTQRIAAQYGLPAPCAAQTGLPSVLFPGFAGAPVQNFSACRNYAQGSSRVTSPAGPNSLAVQAAVSAAFGGGVAGTTAAAQAAGLGLMAVPLVTQMNTHLSAAGGSYRGTELVTVMAGGNDVFMQLNGVSSAAAGGGGAQLAGSLAGWAPSVLGAVTPGGAAATNAAATAAAQGMAQAGTELAGYVKTLVVAKGAKYVAVVNLPDVSQTPFAFTFDAGTRALISTLVTTYNSALQAGLAGTPGVVMIDAYTQSRDQNANPAQYSLTNVTATACSATSTANPLQGSSLTCTASSTVAGDTSRYAFADGVHPTPYAYQLLAQFVALKLSAAGW